MSDRSHVFFDVNALIKLAQSLSHHCFDSQGRFSRIILFSLIIYPFNSF